MTPPQFVKAKALSLRGHAYFTERWVQDLIHDDPSILGLGSDLLPRAYEKRQTTNGRLDLLLEDTENNRRFEVEPVPLQLLQGALAKL
ncbi:MAG: hypothetical protein QOD77_1887 [Thermoplasmata archaeon]|jgi:hypothetical protein|nr:hypothetical protein [Thermoplasmata archaeon]